MKKKKGKKTTSTKKDDTKDEEETPDTATTNAEEQVGSSEQPTEDKPDKGDDVAVDNDKAVEDEKAEDGSPSSTPSLAQQSKLRSTSFRAGAAGPASPGPFSPDGDTAPDIYRKQVSRIEELEKDNKKLSKDYTDSEKRWKKAEDELAVLREGDGDSSSKGKSNDEAEKLVSRAFNVEWFPNPN